MIPSLLQIPSAVSDSKLHSVLPNNGKGDFTFDRSTGATRINKNGLIEEVGYFSSELVQNGNFSELGSELVVNGSFESNSDWSNFGTPTTSEQSTDKAYIGNHSWHIIGTAFRQGIFSPNNFSLVNGKTYKASLWIYAVDGAEIQSGVTNSDAGVFTSRAVTQNEWTNVVYYFTANASSASYISVLTSSSTLEFYVDNVSVKQVDPNDRWTLASNWSYATNKITSDGSQTGNVSLTQANSIMGTVTGKVYQVKFTISDYSAGTINAHIQGQGSTNVTGNGEKKVIVTASSASYGINMYADSNFTGSVSNISVVEVQGDRPRLSYDITNGVVEDKPHLLLEPSSTNLLTFSEDFSQWENIRTTDALSSISSPSNTTNVYKIIPSVDNNNHRIDKQLTLTNGNTYSLSFFAKKGEYNCIQAAIGQSTVINNFVSFNLNTGVKTESGTIANSSMTLLPNGWYRCSLTAAAGTIDRVVMGIGNNDVYSFVGDASSGLYLWGAMIEEKAFSTSYIPTAGTTITRAAETCNNSKPSVNSTEGVLYAEIAALVSDDSVFRTISIGDGSTINNSIRIAFTSTNNQIVVATRVSNSDQSYISHTLSNAKEFNKIAYQSKSNEFKLYVNGVLISTDTSGSVPSAGSLTTLNFDRQDGQNDFYGKVKGLAVYNEALSESQLFQLTGVTASSIYNNFVTRTASFTVEALNEVKKVIDNL